MGAYLSLDLVCWLILFIYLHRHNVYKYLIVHTLMGVLCMHLYFKRRKRDKKKKEARKKIQKGVLKCVSVWCCGFGYIPLMQFQRILQLWSSRQTALDWKCFACISYFALSAWLPSHWHLGKCAPCSLYFSPNLASDLTFKSCVTAQLRAEWDVLWLAMSRPNASH